MLFKSGKSWPDSAEDRGYQLSRPVSSVSHCMLAIHIFYSHILRNMLNVLSIILLGLDEKGGTDPLSGPTARRTGRPTSDEDAGPGALQGAEEEGREGGQKDPGGLHRRGTSDTISEGSNVRSTSEEDEEEED